jgi:hypothetical protein
MAARGLFSKLTFPHVMVSAPKKSKGCTYGAAESRSLQRHSVFVLSEIYLSPLCSALLSFRILSRKCSTKSTFEVTDGRVPVLWLRGSQKKLRQKDIGTQTFAWTMLDIDHTCGTWNRVLNPMEQQNSVMPTWWSGLVCTRVAGITTFCPLSSFSLLKPLLLISWTKTSVRALHGCACLWTSRKFEIGMSPCYVESRRFVPQIITSGRDARSVSNQLSQHQSCYQSINQISDRI